MYLSPFYRHVAPLERNCTWHPIGGLGQASLRGSRDRGYPTYGWYWVLQFLFDLTYKLERKIECLTGGATPSHSFSLHFIGEPLAPSVERGARDHPRRLLEYPTRRLSHFLRLLQGFALPELLLSLVDGGGTTATMLQRGEFRSLGRAVGSLRHDRDILD